MLIAACSVACQGTNCCYSLTHPHSPVTVSSAGAGQVGDREGAGSLSSALPVETEILVGPLLTEVRVIFEDAVHLSVRCPPFL